MNDMPIGLAMSLAEDEEAMRRFALLSEHERDQVVTKARLAGSRDDMLAIVHSLA